MLPLYPLTPFATGRPTDQKGKRQNKQKQTTKGDEINLKREEMLQQQQYNIV